MGIDDTVVTYKSGRFSRIEKSDGSASEHTGIVEGFTEDVQGNIWALIDTDHPVAGSGRLLRIKDLRLEQEIPMADFVSSHYLAADRNAGIWVAFKNGRLAHYLNRNAETVVSLGSVEDPVTVYSLFVDSDNAVLVTSSKGLYRLKDGRLNRLDSGSGLPCSYIFTAIKDNYGDFWLYARCGLLRISASDWKAWLEFPDRKVSAKTFDALDGAQPGMGEDQPTASKSPDGRLWFASDEFVQMMDLGRIYANAIPPPVHIEELIVDHKSYDALGQLSLPSLRRELEINYTALSFKVPRKVLFRYKLEGQDKIGKKLGRGTRPSITIFGPETTRFRVIACNNDGVWNEEGAFLDFSIGPGVLPNELVPCALCGRFPRSALGSLSPPPSATPASRKEASRCGSNNADICLDRSGRRLRGLRQSPLAGIYGVVHREHSRLRLASRCSPRGLKRRERSGASQ